MEVKIKAQEKLIDATIEIVDGVMVVSPKEVKKVKFEPKDGDVIVSGGDVRFVAIFSRMKNDYSFYYYVLLVLEGDKVPQTLGWASFLNIRPATEEEKKTLFDKLAKEGFNWDSDNRELVRIKWKPLEEYWYPNMKYGKIFPSTTFWKNQLEDDRLFNMGWCFKTASECQVFCNRLNEVINNVKP